MTLETPAAFAPDELMEISMGPQHPSTHGVFRMDARLDGERVVRLKPGLRLPAPQPREDRRERQLPGSHSLYRSAGLPVFDDQQLGVCAGGGKSLPGSRCRSAPNTFG